MSVESFSVENAISVTPAAAEHFARTLEKNEAKALRISLKESGCTGFKYVIDEVQGPEEGDQAINLDNGIVIYLDPKHVAALNGMVIDYVKEGLNKNLVLNNPNVKDICGCGESFSV